MILRRFWPVLILALVPVWPLWRAIFLGEAIGPWDHIAPMIDASAPAPTTPWDVLQADAALQFAPWRSLVFDSWSRGELPLWNPYQLCGIPLLANSQSAGFYPPHILMGVLRVPLFPAITFLAWFHLFWAGLGVYHLVRKMGGDRTGATVGGVLFASSAFMLAWTPLPSIPSTISWIPWLLACICGLFQEPVEWRRWMAGVAANFAMMLLAGHLQFAAYGVMAAIVLTCGLMLVGGEQKLRATRSSIELVQPDNATGTVTRFEVDERHNLSVRTVRPWKALAWVVAGVGIGACLASVQLLPVMEASMVSHRATVATEDNYKNYIRGSLGLEGAMGLVFPTALGHPRQQSDSINGANSYWPALSKPGANFAETAIAIGPLAVILLPFAFRRRGAEKWLLAAIGAAGLSLAFGTAVNRVLYFGVPGWAASGSPGRASILFVLIACALAATGATQLTTQGWQPFRKLSASAILIVLALVATPLAFLLLSPIATAQGPAQSISAQAPRIATINQGWNLYTSPAATFPPNLSTLLRVHGAAGYDSLLPRDSKAMLDEANGQDSAPPENGNMLFVKPTASLARLAEMGVTEVWSRGASGEVTKTPIDGPGRVSLSNGRAEIVHENLDSITVRTSGSGRLVLRDRNSPGWSVTVDGKPFELRGERWRELDLPRGDHEVRFLYRPDSLKRGAVLSALGALLLAVLTFCDWARFRKKTSPNSMKF